MLNIVSSFQTNIKENDLGDCIKFKTSICFTIIMKEALDLQAHIIIRKPYENLESRGEYIITGYNTSKSFLETKENFVPSCSLEDLFDNREDLLILSGGIDSLFNNLVKKNKMKDINDLASILKNKFKDFICV